MSGTRVNSGEPDTRSDPERQTGHTAWVRNLAQPVRVFVATEVGSALILLAAAAAALLWANSPWGDTYEQFWHTELSIRLAGASLDLDLRHWVNDGLMAFFFMVVGLEIRRELDMGDLRERRRVAVPVLAAIGGMLVPALIYAAFNAGTDAAHGWGIVMATDTAFALGVLALVGRHWPMRLRVFVLTLVVVDDVGALLVIALFYTEDLSFVPLLFAAALFALVLGMRRLGVRHGAPYFLVGVGLWLALLQAGVHPTIAGVMMGLLATAYPPSRDDLQRAANLWRAFREQPTSRFARTASRGVNLAISPNERLQQIYHPWTSYLIVPVFALANAGVQLDSELLGRAVSSPVTIGILLGLVVGKLAGITGMSWLATRRWLGGFPLTVAWPPLIGAATVAGIGFTVSLFIAELSFEGDTLDEAKVGILAASVTATLLGWLVFRLMERLPASIRDGSRTGLAEPLIDLAEPVDPDRDHIRGPEDAAVTLVEYGDYECPYCGQAEPVIRDLLAEFGRDMRYVFRHLPLTDVHEHAELAAEAAEIAGAMGKFWEFHDLLFANQHALTESDLLRYAEQLGLDVEVFEAKLRKRKYAPRVAHDVESADLSGVVGTPTLFINGKRYYGAFDLQALTTKIRNTLGQIDRSRR
ncbi:MAG TPA: Na+/H+ antiporter NhaA [Natronosporangium sp.]